MGMRALALGAALLGFGGPVTAEEQRFMQELPDDVVAAFMQIAREDLSQARLPDGSFVPAETPEELQRPILPSADAERIVDIGFASAVANWCGVEWRQDSYMPMMEVERGRGIWSDKQLAYIGLLHGVTLGIMSRQYLASGSCSEAQRQQVRAFISRRWPKAR